MAFNTEKYAEILGYFNNFTEINHNINKTIIAVSKTRMIEDVILAINGGISHFGEIRINEAIDKFTEIKKSNNNIKLHMIGGIQTNKVKKALKIFDFFHSLDRNSLAVEFSKYPEEISTKSFFIQINTGHEKQKSGVYPEHSNEFIDYCKNDLKLKVVGLMCIPPIDDNPKEHFLMLANLAKQNNLDQLSMGMSSDYKTAIECGATHIRIGTSLFGSRD